MESLTIAQILDAGLDDWRKLAQALHARFPTGDFVTGLTFVTAVTEAAEAANHHPDVTLTYPCHPLRRRILTLGLRRARCARVSAASLFPVRDRNVCGHLGILKLKDFRKDWVVFRSLVRDPEIDGALNALPELVRQSKGVRHLAMDTSRLRLLDAALWSYTVW